ncbi:MAG: UDP-N-acetylenolpyruvoylglucosamine reductase, partial [Parcubacteria group bacterium]
GAGRLIEKCGLKGKHIGGAMISEKHANYIVNTGNATSQDVRKLISLIQKEVFDKTGYSLEPEISFIGEF